MTGGDYIVLGANARAQAVLFALCFAAGLAAGVAGLLYLRRGSTAERILTDLFATLLIAAGAILCIEFIMDGAIEFYGVVAYLLGASVIPFAAAKLRAAMRKRKESRDKRQ